MDRTGGPGMGIEPKALGLKDDPFFYLLSHSHPIREKCVSCLATHTVLKGECTESDSGLQNLILRLI